MAKQKLAVTQRYSLRSSRPVRTKRSLRSKIILTCLITISLVSLAVLALPYLPHLSFLFHRPKIDATPYHQAAASKEDSAAVAKKPGNRLVLPDIGVDTQIIEGRNIYVIGKNQGVWHETNKINPAAPGNMVIAGHRFLYTATNGGWFYNLPELKIGQKIYVRWDNVTYEYEVYRTRTVKPTQTDVRDPDPEVPYKLTMYTCYPLGSTAQRFVVEAKQIN